MNTSEFTFPDTGIRVRIRKVSPFLWSDVEASMPAPLPPEQEVDYGEPRGKVMERNYADPAYALLVEEHRKAVYLACREAWIVRGVEPIDPDWEKQVQEYREFIQRQTGRVLAEKNNLLVYVLRVCVGTSEDLNDLIAAITQRSQPTREVVAAAKDSF